MFTNSDILKSILKSKGFSVYDIYLKMGSKRNVYKAFDENVFTKKFIDELSLIVGEDLSMFINFYY